MAFLSFLVDTGKGTNLVLIDQDGAAIREVPIDATTGETHIIENQITEHPVEDGSDINDHIRRKPDKLALTGIFSDTALSLFDKAERVREAEPHTIRALNFFEEAAEKKYLLAIENRFKSYTNMGVSSITFSRGVSSGKRVQFQVNLKKVTRVESLVLQGAAAKEITTGINSPTQNQGKLSTSTPTEKASEAGGSFLARITGLGA